METPQVFPVFRIFPFKITLRIFVYFAGVLPAWHRYEQLRFEHIPPLADRHSAAARFKHHAFPEDCTAREHIMRPPPAVDRCREEAHTNP